MSNFSAHLIKCHNLARVARQFAENGVPDCAWDDGRENNSWSATKEEMEIFLGRDLTDEEITVLSLSRGFGPTQWLSDKTLVTKLWPEGNPKGVRYEWALLAEALITFYDGSGNAVIVYPAGLDGVYIVELLSDAHVGYLAEEDGSDQSWFGTRICPLSLGMNCIGWFGPVEGWRTAEQAIRSLGGYEVDQQLLHDVARYEDYWAKGELDDAEVFARDWHPDAFEAQLWSNVTPDMARRQAVAAITKLMAVVDRLPACAEQAEVRNALKALGLQ